MNKNVQYVQVLIHTSKIEKILDMRKRIKQQVGNRIEGGPRIILI